LILACYDLYPETLYPVTFGLYAQIFPCFQDDSFKN